MARAGKKGNPTQKKLQGKRILIVEDHPSVSRILADVLGRYGYPSHANSGRDALKQIEHKAPDLILLDLRLPDMNGLEVARLVRRDEKIRHTPILAMSASPMDYKKCLEAGCNDFYPQALPSIYFVGSTIRTNSLECRNGKMHSPCQSTSVWPSASSDRSLGRLARPILRRVRVCKGT